MLRILPWLLCAGCLPPLGGDMVASQDLGVTGVWLDPNPLTGDVPKGAMRRADEAVFRRKGTVEPRPGFKLLDEFAEIASLYALLPFAGDYLAVGQPVVSNTTVWSDDTNVTDGATPLSWSRDAIRACETRKNLYLTTSDAPRKLTGALDTAADRVGAPSCVLGAAVVGSGTAIPALHSAAYRALIKRTDANDFVTRSAPSGRAIVKAVGVTDIQVTFYLRSGEDTAVGDVVELYRTRSTSTSSPSDEMYLVYEHELTSANLAAGFVTITDTLPDADLVLQALYTNSSREGTERENVRPPLCTDLALYAGSMFASRITYPHRLLVRYDESGDVTAAATGIGLRTYTGFRTAASADLTLLSSTVGLKVGMLLVGAPALTNWSGTDPVRITAINGATLTMSATWGGATDGGASSLIFADSIRISDGSQDRYFRADFATWLIRDIATATSDTARTSPMTNVLAYGVGDTEHSSLNGINRRVVFERRLPSQAEFEVWATHGDEYFPPLPEPSVADGAPSVQDVFENGLTWSKADQPEHFMRGARWLVGKGEVPILRIFAAGDALWILKGKGDGIYRLSGFGERSGWRVDQRDADTYLLHPELATRMGDAVYAWTNKGAVSISDRGIIPLSEPAIGSAFADMQITLDHTAEGPGAFAVANEKNGEVIFGLPPATPFVELPVAEQVWVLNTDTKAWSRWFVPPGDNEPSFSAAAYDPSTRLLLLGEGGAGLSRIERGPDEDYVRLADREFTSITVDSVIENTDGTGDVVINGGSDWTPAVGDLLRNGDNYAIVTAIASATAFTVHDFDGVVDGAGSVAYEHFDAVLEWLTKTGGAPSELKRFRELVTHWEDTFGLYAWAVQYEPLKYGATTSASYTRTYDRTEDSADDTRAHVPRNAQMGTRLGLTLSISQADARWRLSGLTLEMESAGRRIAR